MALARDFVGVGMPDIFAQLEGFNPPDSVTAAGTNSATALALKLAQNWVLMIGDSSGNDGIRMPSGTLLCRPYVVTNIIAQASIVYPATGGKFAAGTTDAGISVPGSKTIICWRCTSTIWAYNLSA